MSRPAFYGWRALGWMVVLAGLAFGLALALIVQVYEVPLRTTSVRFERPWAILLLLGPLLVLMARGFLQHRRSPRLRVSYAASMAQAGAGPRIWFRPALVGLRVTALALMVFALMGPQSIHARSTAQVEGIDLVLTLDVSLSMQAEDIRPNRFLASKQVVVQFVERRPQDRIGAVVFGRDAYTLMPLTTDHAALTTSVAELELGMIDGKGTAIGNAVGVALNRLRKSQAKSKAIILLTDGNSNAGNISPEQAANYAQIAGVKVFTILMGESDEATVSRGRGAFGLSLMDRGSFPINPELLKTMANKTKGRYFQVTDRQGLERSFHAILDELEKSEIEDAGVMYGELFMAFLGPALVLLLLELFAASLVFRRWP